jgi:hypothetical protein
MPIRHNFGLCLFDYRSNVDVCILIGPSEGATQIADLMSEVSRADRILPDERIAELNRLAPQGGPDLDR